MKNTLTCIFTFVFIILLPFVSFAQENNKVGISLLQPSSEDIAHAAELINSNDGDWGYVTLVIQENDRDVRKWQDLFEQLREKHLIPIVRLATSPQGEVWRRPEESDAKEWADFLNKLNWVIKKRYLVLFNEPNHASEWGGEVDPEGYAKIADKFVKTIKESNKDYIVMLAGMDAAAPSYPPQFEDSGIFIRKVFETKDTQLKDDIDAWASHSYPNPGFSGSVWDTNKKSIKGYEYELELLQEMGVTHELPVFITETGWLEGKLSDNQIAENNKIAFNEIWGTDGRIQAVTPFVFKYLSEPFKGFSWIHEEGLSQKYEVIKGIKKKKGEPDQIQEGSIHISLPQTLIASSSYHFPFTVKNSGQAIWSSEDGYVLSFKSSSGEIKTLISPIQKIKPFEESQVFINIQTPIKPQTIKVSLSLRKGKEQIIYTKEHSIVIEPLPHLTIKTSLFPKLLSQAEGFEVQLFNKQEELIYSKKGISMRKGVVEVDRLTDIIPGEAYRVVLIGYPYIPRQEITTINKGKNYVKLKQLLPFDANGNGQLDWGDILEVFKHPSFLLRFVPWNQL